jgi:hypothetical protein
VANLEISSADVAATVNAPPKRVREFDDKGLVSDAEMARAGMNSDAFVCKLNDEADSDYIIKDASKQLVELKRSDDAEKTFVQNYWCLGKFGMQARQRST